MHRDDMEFLDRAVNVVKNNPEMFGHLVTACTRGIVDRVREEQERAMDFESVALASMALVKENRKTPSTIKWADSIIQDHLAKWHGKTSFKWDEKSIVK